MTLPQTWPSSVNTQEPILSGSWFNVPSSFRLLFNGTGAVQISNLTASGVTNSNVFSYTLSGSNNELHSYISEDASQIKVVFPNTVTVSLML